MGNSITQDQLENQHKKGKRPQRRITDPMKTSLQVRGWGKKRWMNILREARVQKGYKSHK
jgi:hypothetical protein